VAASTSVSPVQALPTTPASAAQRLSETCSSLVNGSGAGVYPIINYEYAIVSTSQASPTRAQDLRAFLNWAVSTGTTQLAQVNFQPLPPSVVTLSQAQIAKIKG
jgi:phosphate transport system substrate-binding protein